MHRMSCLLFATLVMQSTFAALPPQYQNMDDLRVMVDFIKQHERVAAELRSIDMTRYTVHFGKDCEAEFKRDHQEKPDGWTGPADPLIFSHSSCPVTWD